MYSTILHDVHTGRIKATMSKAHLVHSCGGTTDLTTSGSSLPRNHFQDWCNPEFSLSSGCWTPNQTWRTGPTPAALTVATSWLFLDLVTMLQLDLDTMHFLLGKLV